MPNAVVRKLQQFTGLSAGDQELPTNRLQRRERVPLHSEIIQEERISLSELHP